MTRLPRLPRRLALLALVLSLTAPVSVAAIGPPDCDLPPPALLAWPVDPGTQHVDATYDHLYIDKWCHSQADLDIMSNGLSLEYADWDEGWGDEDVCNVYLPYARLLNAAYVVRLVENAARPHGLHREVFGVPDVAFQNGEYWSFAGGHSADEWEPSCDYNGAYATHYTNVNADNFYEMHLLGSYQQTAVDRGSTIVHETAHEDVGHDGDCANESGSCDVGYGAYNANTMQINYLHDAYLAYLMVGDTEHRVVRDNEVCSFLYQFSLDERVSAKQSANTFAARFEHLPDVTALEEQLLERGFADYWRCESCDPAPKVFHPDRCDQTACNEVLNHENALVNAANQSACTSYNSQIAAKVASGELTPTMTADLWGAVQVAWRFTNTCLPADDNDVRAFCESEKAAAVKATDIDSCGWLESNWTIAVDRIRCIKEWCIDKFQANPAAASEWLASDPLGCLDYLCGGAACGNDRTNEQCVFEFQLAAYLGDTAASCEFTGCHGGLVDCVYPYYLSGAWAFGQPFPSICQLEYTGCRGRSKAATFVFMNLQRFANPSGPYERLHEQAYARSNSPARNFYRLLRDTRAVVNPVGTATDVQADAAIRLTANREMVTKMFRAAPGQFVWLFGAEGLRDVLGPSVDSVVAEPITDADLTAEGVAWRQELLDQLGALGATTAPMSMGTMAQR